MGWMLLAIYLVLLFGFTKVCTGIAVRRGRSEHRWTYLALFFGPFALLAALFLPSVDHCHKQS